MLRHIRTATAIIAAVATMGLATGIAGAAQNQCTNPGETCTIQQGAIPSWLTIANGSLSLTQQTFSGVTAQEYKAAPNSDPSVFGTMAAYEDAPKLDADVIGSTLFNRPPGSTGTDDPGDTYAAFLTADHKLTVLGPQRDGYACTATVPVPVSDGEEGAGVFALAPGAAAGTGIDISPASTILVVVTDAGRFQLFRFTPGGAPDSGGAGCNVGDGTLEYEGVTPVLGEAQSFHLSIPSGDRVLGVYQAPPGHGEPSTRRETFEGWSWQSPEPQNETTVAIAFGRPDESKYSVGVWTSGKDGGGDLTPMFPLGIGQHVTHPGDEGDLLTEAEFPSGSYQPHIALAYAISNGYLRITALSADGDHDTMQSWSTDEPGGEPTKTACPAPSDGGLATLSVDALLSGTDGWEPLRSAVDQVPQRAEGASLCAAVVGGTVQYAIARTETSDVANYNANTPIETVTPASGSAVAVAPSIDFPCDEFLAENYIFESASTPDICNADGQNSPITMEPPEGTHPPRGPAIVGVQLEYMSGTGTRRTLQLAQRSYETTPPERSSDDASMGLLNDVTTDLGQVPDPTTDTLTALPLDPTPQTWNAQLVTNSAGTAAYTQRGTANPVPIAALAAPPYYNGAEQEVDPTALTFFNQNCNGSSTESDNSVGAVAGIDDDWGVFEVEALATIESSWSQDTSVSTCHELDQRFVTGDASSGYAADNSLVFRVDSGEFTYMDLTANSLGVGITGGCTSAFGPDEKLSDCDPIFNPKETTYAIQTVAQLRDPAPNNSYAAVDRQLQAKYGAALDRLLPAAGNIASYPGESTDGQPPANCADPSAPQPGQAHTLQTNPFAPNPAPSRVNFLQASQATDVNPSTSGNESGTSSELSYDSSEDSSSSASFSVGAEATVTIAGFEVGASYSHGWGASQTTSFDTGTSFSGGVDDFSGFYAPYTYRLYECNANLSTNTGGEMPVFLIDYRTAQLSVEDLELNMIAPSLPDGTEGQSYGGDVFAAGGAPPYSYKITAGSEPPGLELDRASGHIRGIPTAAGTYAFTVTATDSEGDTASQRESITIDPPVTVPAQMPGATVQTPYDHTLAVSGGKSYQFAHTAPAASELPPGAIAGLPPGLDFDNGTGEVTGTPTKTGDYCVDVYVSEIGPGGARTEGMTCITVRSDLALSTSSLPHAISGAPYATAVVATGGDRSGYNFSATEPPSGISIDPATGKLTGTAPAPGTYGFEVAVTDGTGASFEGGRCADDALGGCVTEQLTLTVEDAGSPLASPSLSGPATVTMFEGEPAQIELDGQGAPAPVVTVSGTLPPGLLAAVDGASATLSGTPATGAAGSYTVIATADNGDGSPATKALTIVVYRRPSVTDQPADVTVAAGDRATLTAVAAGAPVPQQVTWQTSSDAGTSWTAVATHAVGEDGSSTLRTEPLDAGEDGELVRAVFSSVAPDGTALGSVTTNAATITVTSGPRIVTQPSPATIAAGDAARFTAAAVGRPTPTAQWQVSTDGGSTWTDIEGATDATLTLTGVSAADDGQLYRARYRNAGGVATTSAAVLTVQTPPTITVQPGSAVVAPGSGASFAITVVGNPPPVIHWQRSTDGGSTWTDIAGATATTLSSSHVTEAMSGFRYRAVATNPLGSDTSQAATLTVSSQSIALGSACTGLSSVRIPSWQTRGPVVRYTVSVAGAPPRTVTGAALTDVALPALSGRDTTIRVVATSRAGFKLTTALRYSRCRLANSHTTIAGARGAPVNSGSPTITGVAAVGRPLTCTVGVWKPLPTSVRITWRRDGVPIPGATGATYVVSRGDAEHALSCVVVAIDLSATSASDASAPIQVGSDRAPSCPQPTGALRGSRLGPLGLGFQRRREQHLLPKVGWSGHGMKYYCLAGGPGIHVGFPSAGMLPGLHGARLARQRTQIALLLTANRHYALRGIRPGQRFAATARRLHLQRPAFAHGWNHWYLLPGRGPTGVIKVRFGVVVEVGITQRRYTATPRADRLLIRRFRRY
ncbi:MAG TPA: putative Ig domain-containing protein [Solirubrobacterales bacterium]